MPSIPGLVKINGQVVSLANLVSEPEPEALTASRLGQTGIWTWFTGPRAVVSDGKLFTGWLKPGNADVVVSSYDLADGTYEENATLWTTIQNDDHANPALWAHPDTGKIRVFWGQHNDSAIKWRDSTAAGDVGTFDSVETVATGYASYCNPHYLADEGRLYYLFRMDISGTGTWRPGLVYSDDPTATTPTWSTQRQIFEGGASDRPYWAYTDNGTDRLDLVFSTGHPAGVSAGAGDIYHFYISGGNFYKTDGTLIRALSTLATTGAITTSEATKVYDATDHKGTAINGNAWPWSIEYDADGHPVIAFSSYSAIDDNRYWYARWTGSAWERHEILEDQGSLFGAGDQVEDQYVGGLCVDPRNTNRLYVSKQVSATQWDMERWTTEDGGATWATETISADSGIKCFRPYCPRGWVEGAPAVVFCRGLYTVSNGPSASVDIYASPAVTPV